MTQSYGASLDAALEQYRLTALPASMYYIPDFITQAEEAYIVDQARPYSFYQTIFSGAKLL